MVQGRINIKRGRKKNKKMKRASENEKIRTKWE